MSQPDNIGDRLRSLRDGRAMTRHELADDSGVSVDLIEKLEHGHRQTARFTALTRLADALGVGVSRLLGRRRPEERDDDRTARDDVQNVRDVVVSADSMPGVDADDAGEAPDLAELNAAVDAAWRDYRSGNMTRLAGALPGLIGEARLASGELGARAAGPLAEAHQLAARLFVHYDRYDLAERATENAIRAAEGGGDELEWETLHGAYSWTLLREGRARASEEHAVWIAESTEPSMSGAALRDLTVWGGLMLAAIAAASAGDRAARTTEYLGLAGSAARRFGHDRVDYHVGFGPSRIATEATHAYAMLHEPGLALRSAGAVHGDELSRTSYGRHLIDVARAQTEIRDLRAAEATLRAAESLCASSFSPDGPACSVVSDVVVDVGNLTPELRRMARAVVVQA
ncbi:helix-turn-helix domain-containing protein [Actinoallomurus purpureus]|uniref:helix-turn-helix domain-containing protein n=1 Tax=Actinoallomurus purpureus TaxID=478114 RepID=UPI0020925FA8|nr:helix-turn-helix transcriptional regulator [Actinoallomurus purpureus]MCO6011395.1 helix-turn-helix domain-containing protein [Actinoallomurus purpureus]